MDCEEKLENREEIINHFKKFLTSLYVKEDWVRPLVDNIAFDSINSDKAQWLERDFNEDEVQHAILNLEGDKGLGQDNFSIAFFKHFWTDMKTDILASLHEFHSRWKIFKNLGASFIVLIPNKSGAETSEDVRPITLLEAPTKS